jgi:hypothetical protein
MILSSLALFLSSNLDLGAMSVKIGPQGFLSYVIPATMLLCGVLTWVTPANRLFMACIGLLVATYSIIGLNFGGFGVGLLFGILGGALALAWTPGAWTPGADIDAGPEDAPADDVDPDDIHHDAHQDDADLAAEGPRSATAPGAALTGPSGEFSFFRDDEQPPRSGGTHRSLFVITLISTTLAAGALVLGGHVPAEAASCPASANAHPATVQPTGAKPVKAKPVKAKPVKAKPSGTPPTSAAVPAAAPLAPAASFAADLGEALEKAVSDLASAAAGLGATADPTSGPEPTVTPTPTAGPTPSPTSTQGTDPTTGPSTGGPTSDPKPDHTSAAPTKPADVPCLGPRLFKTTTADGMPMASLKGGVVTGTWLTMYDSTYDGVVELRTSSGVVKALQFTMNKAVTQKFKLLIDEPGDVSTAITSSELTIAGNVKFYTTKFTGKLFGLFPVTFTPEAPPPLMLPVLSFSEVVIDLAFLHCDTLTAKALKVVPV